MISVTPYKNGLKNGTMKVWHENGKLYKKVDYKNDKINGLSQKWYDDGKKEWVIPYVNGKEEGTYKQYNIVNGRLQSLITYMDGEKNGKYAFYRDNGTLESTGYWVNGVQKPRLTAYEKKEMAAERKARKAMLAQQAREPRSVSLICSSGSNYSLSEIQSKNAIAEGQGKGAGLAYQMNHGNSVNINRGIAKNYCTNAVNAKNINCQSAQIFVSACMNSLGH